MQKLKRFKENLKAVDWTFALVWLGILAGSLFIWGLVFAFTLLIDWEKVN